MVILTIVVALHILLFLLFYMGGQAGNSVPGRSTGEGRSLSVFRLADGPVDVGSSGGETSAADRSAAGAPVSIIPDGTVGDTGQGSGDKAGDALLGDALAAALSDDPFAGGGWASYQAILRRHIARYRQSPTVAGERRYGTAVVRINIDRNGRIIDARVLRTQGASLDEAALDALWRADPLPAVPAGLAAPLGVDVPIEFVRG